MVKELERTQKAFVGNAEDTVLRQSVQFQAQQLSFLENTGGVVKPAVEKNGKADDADRVGPGKFGDQTLESEKRALSQARLPEKVAAGRPKVL